MWDGAPSIVSEKVGFAWRRSTPSRSEAKELVTGGVRILRVGETLRLGEGAGGDRTSSRRHDVMAKKGPSLLIYPDPRGLRPLADGSTRTRPKKRAAGGVVGRIERLRAAGAAASRCTAP